jgi:hypothetical protein
MYSRSIPDGQHGEHDPGRVMLSLEFAGQELKANVRGLQLLGQRGQFQSTPESLVLVDDEGDRDARRAHLAGQRHGLVQLGSDGGASGDLLGEDPGNARGLSESSWMSSDWRSVEARA